MAVCITVITILTRLTGGERFPGMMITYALMNKFEHVCETDPGRAQLVTKAEVTRLLRNEQGEVRHGLLGMVGWYCEDPSLAQSFPVSS